MRSLGVLKLYRIAQEIDVLVTTGGGHSFLNYFMRHNTAVVYIQHYKPSSQSAVSLEGYVLDYIINRKVIYYPVTQNEMVVVQDYEWKDAPISESDPLHEDWVYRHYPNYQMNVNRFTPFHRHAIRYLHLFSKD